jgi:hypothetical protein
LRENFFGASLSMMKGEKKWKKFVEMAFEALARSL